MRQTGHWCHHCFGKRFIHHIQAHSHPSFTCMHILHGLLHTYMVGVTCARAYDTSMSWWLQSCTLWMLRARAGVWKREAAVTLEIILLTLHQLLTKSHLLEVCCSCDIHVDLTHIKDILIGIFTSITGVFRPDSLNLMDFQLTADGECHRPGWELGWHNNAIHVAPRWPKVAPRCTRHLVVSLDNTFARSRITLCVGFPHVLPMSVWVLSGFSHLPKAFQ